MNNNNSMECGCVCDLEYDPPEFLRSVWRRAKKEHMCCECNETIQVGSQYEYVSGKWEGDFYTFKTCTPCANIRRDYCCSYGGLRDELREILGIDYVTGKILYDDEED